MTRKNYPLRINKNLYDEIEKMSVKEDRSVNYIINKLLEESLNNKIDIKDFILQDMKNHSRKANISVSELVEQIWKAFKRTYK